MKKSKIALETSRYLSIEYVTFWELSYYILCFHSYWGVHYWITIGPYLSSNAHLSDALSLRLLNILYGENSKEVQIGKQLLRSLMKIICNRIDGECATKSLPKPVSTQMSLNLYCCPNSICQSNPIHEFLFLWGIYVWMFLLLMDISIPFQYDLKWCHLTCRYPYSIYCISTNSQTIIPIDGRSGH